MLTGAALTQLSDVAVVFDQYRRHYGQPVVPGRALAWLTENAEERRLAIFTARRVRIWRAWPPLSRCLLLCGWAVAGNFAIFMSCLAPAAAGQGARC